jgi:ketosteroid isomerase-like protein
MSKRPQWLDGLFASIDGMDADQFVSYLTDDAVFRWGAMPPANGRDTIHETVKGVFGMFKALRHTIHGTWVHPDAVFVQGEADYTRLDGSVVSLPFLNCFKMRDAKIQEYLIYLDPTPLAQ